MILETGTLATVASAQNCFGEMRVNAAKVEGSLHWDESPGLKLSVTWTLSDTMAPMVSTLAQQFPEHYFQAIGTLWTKVYGSQEDPVGPEQIVKKFFLRSVALYLSTAEVRMEPTPGCDPPQWSAQLRLIPSRTSNDNAQLLDLSAATPLECTVQVEGRLYVNMGEGEKQLGPSITCIPTWIYSLSE